MTVRTVIYQPCYYPKLHYLSRISNADKLIIFDDVEFSRRSCQHRAEIKFGDKRWLTIPTQHTGSNIQINEAVIDNSQRWQDKHVGTLKHKYGGGIEIFEPYYDQTRDAENSLLVDFTVNILLELFDQFDINTTVYRSSEIPISHPGDPSKYLAQLTEHVSGTDYVCGQRAYDEYLDDSFFDDRGIEIDIQDWESQWPDGNVCSLDVLYNTDDPSRFIE